MFKYPLNVTLDTNIFIANKFDFSEGSTLHLLQKNVQKNKLNIFLSDIVIRESEKHIVESASKLCGIARKLRTEAMNVASEELINSVGLERLLELPEKKAIVEKSKKELHDFINSLNPEILDIQGVKLDAVIKDYFEVKPPFENSEKKRREFPDAFIANQIRNRFGEDKLVAIISNDRGLKAACGATNNQIFFSSLGELFDAMNKQEEEYQNAVGSIGNYRSSIIHEVKSFIRCNDCVEVIGRSYDKDGISYGYDYKDTSLKKIHDVTFVIRTIDEILDNTIVATLQCEAKIEEDCLYDDYDNAAWDRETDSYFYVDTCHIVEKHNSRFACRVEIDLKMDAVRLMPFKVILNSDTLEDIYEAEDVYNYDIEDDILNMERDAVGLQTLDSYDDYLKRELQNSGLVNDIIALFDEINDIFSAYGEIGMVYDSLIELIKRKPDSAKRIISVVASRIEDKMGFPLWADIEDVTDDDLKEVLEWTKNCYEETSKISETEHLPDNFSLGDNVRIFDDSNNEYTLSLGTLSFNPSEGEEVMIDIDLYDNDMKTIASGSINLTVGFIHYDEDGGVADALDDSVMFDYDSIVDSLKEIVDAMKGNLLEYQEIAEVLNEVI